MSCTINEKGEWIEKENSTGNSKDKWNPRMMKELN